MLVAGPTGSGKSTTLFGILKNFNPLEYNISTLEDPIEYDIEYVNQSQVHPGINYTFASGLRSLVRQDPDIIMVGENTYEFCNWYHSTYDKYGCRTISPRFSHENGHFSKTLKKTL